jgi:hypothetical protein
LEYPAPCSMLAFLLHAVYWLGYFVGISALYWPTFVGISCSMQFAYLHLLEILTPCSMQAFPVPYNMLVFPIPCSMLIFPIPWSILVFPIPCSMLAFPAPCSMLALTLSSCSHVFTFVGISLWSYMSMFDKEFHIVSDLYGIYSNSVLHGIQHLQVLSNLTLINYILFPVLSRIFY